jgi:hypothetical protein
MALEEHLASPLTALRPAMRPINPGLPRRRHSSPVKKPIRPI